MKEHPQPFNDMNSLANTIRITLLIALVITPWFFGGVWADVQWLLLLAVAILLGLELVVRYRPSNRPSFMPTAWLPLLLGILLGVLQLIPWTPSLGKWFAGESVEYQREFASPPVGDMQTEESVLPSHISRTLYAAATREQVALLTLGTSVFILASLCFVERRAIFWLCVSTAVGGAALSFFGVVQRLTWNGKFYWFFEPLYGGVESFGPFVNRNNAGGFLNLCLAAGLGLWIWIHPQSNDLSKRIASLREQVSDYVGSLNAPRLSIIILVISISGGVLCTASRGSILAMFVAFGVTAFALALKSQHRRAAAGMALVLVAGAALMSWAGQTEFVANRFDRLERDAALESGRFPNWLDALQTVPDFWGTGTGLGTYRYVYERFQTRYLRDIAHFHAENQYIQALVEGGLVALSLLLISILFTTLALIRLFQVGGTTNTMLAVTGTFALTSQVVGACFDFGLYIPANMLLMATICGAVVGRVACVSLSADAKAGGSSTRSSDDVPATKQSNKKTNFYQSDILLQPDSDAAHLSRSSLFILTPPSLLTSLVLGMLLLGCLFGCIELRRTAEIASALRKAPLDRVAEMDSPEELAILIKEIEDTLPKRWDDAHAHQHLAALLTQRYRAETYRSLTTELNGFSSAAKSPTSSERNPKLWSQSSVWHLHKTINALRQQGDQEAVSRLLSQPSIRHLARAELHAIAARIAAPTIPQVHYLLAELSAIKSPQADNQIHLERARTLAPGDASQWYWTGLLDLHQGRVEQACRSWRRSLELSSEHLDDIVIYARQQLSVEQLIDQILPPRSELLLTVARRNFNAPEELKTYKLLLARADEILSGSELPADKLAYVTGTLHRLQGRPGQAVIFLEKAVSQNRSRGDWRFELAVLLTELQRYEEALQHLLLLQRERPEKNRYQRLYERINRERHRAGAPANAAG
ncbi:MAG: hypothetical protein CMJ77_24200 [Planctomycetaceae bacterium]|nr:hypothetical protein [Planctomycetaceae bacterium]